MNRTKRGRPLLWAALLIIAALSALSIAAYRYIGIPGEYRALARAHAAQKGIDPHLVMAVIFAESRAKPAARSPVGAVGLMQIMPATGGWIAQRTGRADYAERQLLDPDVNVEMGAWYLRYLLDYYGGDVSLALCAYNAGPGTVNGWLRDSRYSADGASLHEIPFLETRNYVAKVLGMQKIYRAVYP